MSFATAAKHAEESRFAARFDTVVTGQIVTNNGHSAFACTVRDLSKTGARIEVPADAEFPEHFTLDLYGNGTHTARLIWRLNNEAGIEFITAETLVTESLESLPSLRQAMFERVEILERQVRDLKQQIRLVLAD